MKQVPSNHFQRHVGEYKILVLLLAALALLWPSPALAESVHARFDLSTPQAGPFPSDRFTVPDPMHYTGLHVINTLDGFNLQPRLSIPFDGPIDVASVTSQSVFLVSLGSTLPDGASGGHVVGINQIVWDPGTNTLHVESDELLDQHTRYVLVVTNTVRNLDGKHVKAAREFLDFIDDANGSTGDPALEAYRTQLRNALSQLDAAGVVPQDQVVTASIFTTQSVTAVLEKIRDEIKVATPAPADFLLGPGGSRTVFALSTMMSVRLNAQVSADPTAPLSTLPLPLSVLNVVPGAVGTIAFGKYSSPDYRVHPGEFIPAVGTKFGTPVVQGSSDVGFILFLPSSPEPATGYPVAIFGHGAGGNKAESGFVAAKLAQQGIAVIAIDQPGNGFGPLSTYTIGFTDLSSVTFPSVGRGIDQNGDGKIGQSEGFSAARPRTILGGRDGQRQTVIDHMQLVREIEVGMDVDGGGLPDLDPSRIYYLGPSRGGIQGLPFLAIEPDVRAGIFTVPGGSGEFRLAASSRGDPGASLQARVPSLINSPGITRLDGLPVLPPYFNENMPLRSGAAFTALLQDGTTQVIRSPLINTIPGAMDIQQVIENGEWASQAGDAVAYAAYIRRKPLGGVPAKAVIVQFANGDRVVPNPTTTAILRAGDLADRATFVRTNLVFPVNPRPFPNNIYLYPHAFLQIFADPALTAIALQAQQQIASFFALDGTNQNLNPFDGTQILDPDGASPVFEVPIVPPLPEALNYFP